MLVEVVVPEIIRCACTRINDPWRRFCGGCGTMLAPACNSCGFVNSRHDRFCGGCGIHVATSQLHDADTVRAARPADPFSTITKVNERPITKVNERPIKGTPRETPRFAKPVDVKQVEPSTMPLDILDEIQ
jgi:hypothetical protein